MAKTNTLWKNFRSVRLRAYYPELRLWGTSRLKLINMNRKLGRRAFVLFATFTRFSFAGFANLAGGLTFHST